MIWSTTWVMPWVCMAGLCMSSPIWPVASANWHPRHGNSICNDCTCACAFKSIRYMYSAVWKGWTTLYAILDDTDRITDATQLASLQILFFYFSCVCQCVKPRHPDHMHGENCCMCGVAAMELQSDVAHDDIYYISMDNAVRMYTPPHKICYHTTPHIRTLSPL